MIFFKIKKQISVIYKKVKNLRNLLKDKLINTKDFIKKKLNLVYLNLLDNIVFRKIIKIFQKIYLSLNYNKKKNENIIKSTSYFEKKNNELLILNEENDKNIIKEDLEANRVNNNYYLFGCFMLVLIGSYVYQAEIILYFFPDLVISNLNLHFFYENPFTFNNQIYYIIDDKVSNIKYVKDYGYYFNKFDINESVLTNMNLYFLTYNTYMRKAQFVGFDKMGHNTDSVKYRYTDNNFYKNQKIFESINENYLYEDDDFLNRLSYNTFRLYLNFFRQETEPYSDGEVSGIIDYYAPHDLEYYATRPLRSYNINPLFYSNINDDYSYLKSFEKMHIYLNKSYGSYIGSNNKNFFSWLYNRYISNINMDLLYNSIFKYKVNNFNLFYSFKNFVNKYFIQDLLDQKLLRKKRLLPNIYPNINYTIEENQKRDIINIKNKEYFYFFFDLYNFFVKLNLNTFLNVQLSDFYYFNKINNFVLLNLKNESNNFVNKFINSEKDNDLFNNKVNNFFLFQKPRVKLNYNEYYYKKLVNDQNYLASQLNYKQNFYNRSYKNNLFLSILKQYTDGFEGNGYQELDNSHEFIPTKMTEEDLDFPDYSRLKLNEAEVGNELINYHYQTQDYIDNIFIKLFPRYNLFLMNPKIGFNTYHIFTMNYLNRLNSNDLKFIQYLNFLENDLKLEDVEIKEVDLLKRFNFLNEYLQFNSFYSLYKKIQLYDNLKYDYFYNINNNKVIDNLKELTLFNNSNIFNIFDIIINNVYTKLNNYYFYYVMEQFYDLSQITDLYDKWDDYGISPIDLYVKKTNFKYKLLESENIREQSREYLKNKILMNYLWSFEYKKYLYFYFKEKYLRPFLFEGYYLNKKRDDIYDGLFLNYMGHSYRSLHRRLFNSLSFELFNFDSKVKNIHNDTLVLYGLMLYKKILEFYLFKYYNNFLYHFHSRYFRFDPEYWAYDQHINYNNFLSNYDRYVKKGLMPLDFTTKDAKYKYYSGLIKTDGFKNFLSKDILIDFDEKSFEENGEILTFDARRFYESNLYLYKEYFNKIYSLYRKFIYQNYTPKAPSFLHQTEYNLFLKNFRLKYYSPFLWDRYSDNIFFENDLRFSDDVYKLFGINKYKGYLNKLRGVSYWDSYIYTDKKIDGYIFNINKKFSKNLITLSKKQKRRLLPFLTNLEVENSKPIENVSSSYYFKKTINKYKFLPIKKKKNKKEVDNAYYEYKFTPKAAQYSMIYNKLDVYKMFYHELFNEELFGSLKVIEPKYEVVIIRPDEDLESEYLVGDLKQKYSLYLPSSIGFFNDSMLEKPRMDYLWLFGLQRPRMRKKNKNKRLKNNSMNVFPFYIKQYFNISLRSLVEKGFSKLKKNMPFKRKKLDKYYRYIYGLNKKYKSRRRATISKYDNSWNLYNSYYFDELRLFEKPVDKNLLSIFYSRKGFINKKGMPKFMTGTNVLDDKQSRMLHKFQLLSQKPYAIQTKTTKMLPLFIRYIYRNKNYNFVVINQKKNDFFKYYFLFERDYLSLPLFYKFFLFFSEIKNVFKLNIVINMNEIFGLSVIKKIYLDSFSFFLFILNFIFKFFYYVCFFIDYLYFGLFSKQTNLFIKLNKNYNYYYKKFFDMGFDYLTSSYSVSKYHQPKRLLNWSMYKQYKEFSLYPFEGQQVYYQKFKNAMSTVVIGLLGILISAKLIEYINLYFLGGENSTTEYEIIDHVVIFLAVGYCSIAMSIYNAYPSLDPFFRNVGNWPMI